MKATRPHHLLAAALVAAGLFAGCNLELPKVDPAQQPQPQNPNGGFNEPSLQALALIDDALGVDRQFELRMPPPPTTPPPAAPSQTAMALAPTDSGTKPPPSMFCDATPEVTVEKVCGLDVITQAHVAWSGCQLPPPPTQDGQQQQTDQVVTSGVLDTNTVVTNSVCSPVTEVTFTRTTAFSLTKKSSKGEMSTSGEVGAEGTRKLAPGTFTRTLAIDVTASTSATDGTRKEFAMQGNLTVSIAAEPGKPPVTGLDGTLNRTGDSPETYQIKQVERGDPMACRWPMKGEISRTLPDGQKHVLTFGPDCGQATLDGKQVSLNPQPQQQQQQQQPPPQ